MASNGHSGVVPSLLVDDDPSPVTIVNPTGRSPFLLIGDHAGNSMPRRLGNLGLPQSELHRHIAWDIGVRELGDALAEACDAVFIRQTYSRLIVDCNRDPSAPDAMPPVSDGTVVAGNAALTAEERASRTETIHEPYHRSINLELLRRDACGQPSVLVSLHSFTPALTGGSPRPWHVGVLHDGGDPSFAMAFLAALRREPTLVVGDNEPYRMDLVDYTVPRHAYAAHRPYVELEFRQDLLRHKQALQSWVEIVLNSLQAAYDITSTAER
ncbi:N-formylglutamate amidohydrolase [Sphingomonas yunnanensis]|uniref:N-formylglutamate amidohydrolase n=1 Tax=Sphingomonas yunnanensis TaxID=310400 RepID=UPI001CA77715|nr:N-formylglutamate amidohydrolase [Sphingomonas yunnanensis]MBY9063626.1 N-formylglutamate amidohydrolase [Sphingomonas yunnanensis]